MSSARRLLITSIPDTTNPDDYYRLSDKYGMPLNMVKFFFPTPFKKYKTLEYVSFSKKHYKFYNKFIDYKPYLIDNFIYFVPDTNTGIDSYETFWKFFLFSFVFAHEYGFLDVLYIPFRRDFLEFHVENFIKKRTSLVYVEDSPDDAQLKDLIIYVPNEHSKQFFDFCFVNSSFFETNCSQKEIFEFILNRKIL